MPHNPPGSGQDEPQQLAHYRVVRKLAEGSMGTVYLAADTHVQRAVALKVFHAHLTGNPEFVARFRREVQATGSLDHANIIAAFDSGEDRGRQFYAMEYFEGETLDAVLKRDGSLPWSAALGFIIQTARGLKHAHEHGFIHRNIKPINIYITKDGVVKILNLGLTKNLGETDQSLQTQPGLVLGTPNYIAPEQARGELHVDCRADIYALGAMFYHLLTGSTPFQGSTVATIMQKHQNEQLPNPRDIRGDIPDAVTQVIRKMMAKEPLDRYRDCGELLGDLELAAAGKAPVNCALAEEKSSVALLMKPQTQPQGIQQVGGFKLIRKLGEGGMGAVYLAEDAAAGRKVALKVLPKRLAGNAEFIARFKREAKATGKLNHLNIVSAFTVGEDQGFHFYAMEYCDGESLDAMLQRDGFLPWKKAFEIVRQIASGLQHAHEHGIVHRDIKPANILLTGNGVAKILDLGLSKNISDTEQSFYTQAGVAVGSPHYISPEQAQGDKHVDGRADIYSLGATLYHLVTGRTPFEGQTAAVVMIKHMSEQLPNPQDVRTGIPSTVVHVIRKMMAKAPLDRYRDCGELLADLELVAQDKQPCSSAVDALKSSIALPKLAAPLILQPALEIHQPPPVNPPIAAPPKLNFVIGGLVGAAVLLICSIALFIGKSANETRISHGATPTPVPQPPVSPAPVVSIPSEAPAVPPVAAPKDDPATVPIAPEKTAPPPPAPDPLPKAVKDADAPPAEISIDVSAGAKMDLVLVTAGEFKMGANDGNADEAPAHKVSISQPFYIGKYDVTVAQFKIFADAERFKTDAEKEGNGRSIKAGKWVDVGGANWRKPGFKQESNHPVVMLSWNDAQAFCNWSAKFLAVNQSEFPGALLRMGKWSVRLPTEAEWEYAARGPESRRYPWGDTWEGMPANVADRSLRIAGFEMKFGETSENDGYAYTSPVGAFKTNVSWCGAFDVIGNVHQWCSDWYADAYYAFSPVPDPSGPAAGEFRVFRGGSFVDPPKLCLSAHRFKSHPIYRAANFGFRVVLGLQKP